MRRTSADMGKQALAVVALGLAVACLVLTSSATRRAELSSDFEPWKATPWDDRQGSNDVDNDWYDQSSSSMGNPAVVGGRRVFLVRQMAAPMQQLSEQPWALDGASDAGSRREKFAFNKLQRQRYTRGEASSYFKAPTQQLSEQPWEVDGTSDADSRKEKIEYSKMQRQRYQRGEAASYAKAPMEQLSETQPWALDGDNMKQSNDERLAYYRNQRQRYNRGEIRMNSMARSPRTQALAEMWEQDQTNDRLRHAEMRKVYQERQDRAARHETGADLV
mmetsp:Transcript_57444/g.136939  ORF Transcript_57444/g.136939 Transcript_57444/m.136939 type:complete len:276 (-) Transcript_57444:100-927(-)